MFDVTKHALAQIHALACYLKCLRNTACVFLSLLLDGDHFLKRHLKGLSSGMEGGIKVV